MKRSVGRCHPQGNAEDGPIGLGVRPLPSARMPRLILAAVVPLVLLLAFSARADAAADLALGKPAAASSTENGWTSGVGPQLANDGTESTRWSSSYANGQWWLVDLGSHHETSRVWINWTSAYASSYRIEASIDGADYATVWQGSAQGSGWKVHNWASRTARYIRFYGVARATGYGFSFADFGVYGFSGAVAGAPEGAPAGAPAPPASSSCPASTSWRPPRSSPLSDAAAAGCVRRAVERRPGNYVANHYRPSATEIATFRAQAGTSNPLMRHVTGGFTGTTDEIIQWAAHKWGIPEDWLRAQFVQETWWNQSAMGDRRDGVDAYLYPPQARIDGDSVYESMGISQIKWRPDSSRNPGTEPLRWKSTAFVADYAGAGLRFYYDGLCTYCGAGYSAGQQWQSVGAHFQPSPWWNAGAQYYVSRVKVRLNDRTWARDDF